MKRSRIFWGLAGFCLAVALLLLLEQRERPDSGGYEAAPRHAPVATASESPFIQEAVVPRVATAEKEDKSVPGTVGSVSVVPFTEVEAAISTPAPEVEMSKFAIHGIVRFSDGEPIPRADLALAVFEEEEGEKDVAGPKNATWALLSTDGAGRFRFSISEEDAWRQYRLVASYRLFEKITLAPLTASVVPVEVVFPREKAGKICLRAWEENQAAGASYAVQVRKSATQAVQIQREKVGVDGWVCLDLPADRYDVFVCGDPSAEEGNYPVCELRNIEVRAGATTGPLEAILRRPEMREVHFALRFEEPPKEALKAQLVFLPRSLGSFASECLGGKTEVDVRLPAGRYRIAFMTCTPFEYASIPWELVSPQQVDIPATGEASFELQVAREKIGK